MGNAITVASLISVFSSWPTVAPEIVQAPSRVTVSEGSIAVLFCKVRAYPEAAIAWRKNGDSLPEDGRFIVSPDSYKLRIIDAVMSDAGAYTCTATNAHGSDETTILVEVKGQLTFIYFRCTYVRMYCLPPIMCSCYPLAIFPQALHVKYVYTYISHI